VLAAELENLGAENVVPGRGMVQARGDLATVYRANLRLRTAMRVIIQLEEGSARSREDVYALAGSQPWERLLRPGQTIAVEAVGRSDRLRNLAFAAQVVKDAMVDRLRKRWSHRPSVDRAHPDIRVHLHIHGDQAHLGIDTSGEPLSHRGYRAAGGPAPLAESLAAGILLLAGYDGTQALLDPMCGTGTLAIEAALIATRSAPGLGRRFAFESWSWHDEALWRGIRDEAKGRIRPAPHDIIARDRERKAMAAVRRSASIAGVEQWVQIEQRSFEETCPIDPGTLVVSNPPYGHRLGTVDQLRSTYRRMGDMLKKNACGSTAWLLMGEPLLAREIGLRPSRRIVLFNGPIECRLVRYEIFQGSLSASDQSRTT
jgi:putative N6-adenine-specific DNA methylase